MKYIGPHVSIAGGVENAPLNANKVGATGFGMFTKNQRQWNAKPLTEENISSFKDAMHKDGFPMESVLVHDSYLINLGSPDQEKWDRALGAFIDEARRVEQLGLHLLDFHPGSHLKQIDEEECLQRIADAMNRTIAETDSVVLVVENTAGQGTNVGYSFEHLARVIELTEKRSRVGVCLDTCHTFAAGYDLQNGDAWKALTKCFEEIVGFRYLRGMHLNDAKSELGSRVDRHAPLGDGNIGLDGFRAMMKDSRLDDIPLILETPEPDRWAEEIELLRSFI